MNGLQTTFLDLIRAVAAQMVLVGHIYVALGGTLPFEIGNFGVLLFFVLSGYLICFTVMRRSQGNTGYGFGTFFQDRFFRIFTPLVPALFLILVLDYCSIHFGTGYGYLDAFTVRDFFGNLLMLSQNPIGLVADNVLHIPELKISTFGSARPHWTVVIEWWIYLFFGWAVLKSEMAKRAPWRFFLVLSLFGIVPLFNIVAGTGEGLTVIWFAAALAAWGWNSRAEPLKQLFTKIYASGYRRLFLIWSLAALFGLMAFRVLWVSLISTGFAWEPFAFYDVTFGVLLLTQFLLIFFYLDFANSSHTRNKLVQSVSDYSYSLYLIHYSLITFFVAMGIDLSSPLLTGLLYFAVCQVVSLVFWWLFERHYRALKKYWVRLRV